MTKWRAEVMARLVHYMLRIIAYMTRHNPKTKTDSSTIFKTGFIGFRVRCDFSLAEDLFRAGRAVRSVVSARFAVSFEGRTGFGTGGIAAEPSGDTIGGGSKYVGWMLPEDPLPGRCWRPVPDRGGAVATALGEG